jgi:hypothetical protein
VSKLSRATCDFWVERVNWRNVSTKAQAILDEIRALPPKEQREVSDFLVRQFTQVPPPPLRRRTIADVAGKYRANPDPEAKDHDCGFADAIAG